MRRTMAKLCVPFAVGMLLALITARSTTAQAPQSIVKLDNQSGDPAGVRLVGPPAQVVEVPNGEKRTVRVILRIGNLYESNPSRPAPNNIENSLKKYVSIYLEPLLASRGFLLDYLGIKYGESTETEKGTLVIEYSETEGKAYYTLGGGGPFWGVNIRCTIKPTHPVSGHLLWNEQLRASNSAEISPTKSFRDSALENLGTEFHRFWESMEKTR